MSAIDAIRGRYESIGRTRIEVPEWGDGDGPAVYYARPYTLADERKISRFFRDDASDAEGWAELIVLMLEDEDGNAVFSKADKPKLLRLAEAYVMKRIGTTIMTASATVTVEAAKKN